MDDSPTGGGVGAKPQASETTLGKGWMQIIILPRIENLERTKKKKSHNHGLLTLLLQFIKLG